MTLAAGRLALRSLWLGPGSSAAAAASASSRSFELYTSFSSEATILSLVASSESRPGKAC